MVTLKLWVSNLKLRGFLFKPWPLNLCVQIRIFYYFREWLRVRVVIYEGFTQVHDLVLLILSFWFTPISFPVSFDDVVECGCCTQKKNNSWNKKANKE